MRKKTLTLSQEKLKKLFVFKKGFFFCRKTISKRHVKGRKILGYQRPNGTIYIGIEGKQYLFHRLVFLYFKGYCPDILDHKNRKTTDNRLCNLRPANCNTNNHNSSLRKDSTVGIKGLTFDSRRNGYWKGRVGLNGKRYSVHGRDKKEVVLKLKRLRKKLHRGFTCHGDI